MLFMSSNFPINTTKKDKFPTTQNNQKLVDIALYRLNSDCFGVVGLEWSEIHFSSKTVEISD